MPLKVEVICPHCLAIHDGLAQDTEYECSCCGGKFATPLLNEFSDGSEGLIGKVMGW